MKIKPETIDQIKRDARNIVGQSVDCILKHGSIEQESYIKIPIKNLYLQIRVSVSEAQPPMGCYDMEDFGVENNG